MIRVLSTNITSPLGFTTEQNFKAVRAGRSALRRYESWKGILPQPVTLSAFSEEQNSALRIDGYTAFESLAIRSVEDALSRAGITASSDRTVFILSTTKCNVSELSAEPESDGAYSNPGTAAGRIAGYFGFVTDPVVVCNACISGITAQLLADRLISAGYYDYAVVCGADVMSIFTVAGFLSFKSLSASECRPFDIERTGLNLGEAASTIVFGKSDASGRWALVSGSLNNDAYHISAPSPDGDGVLRTVKSTLEGISADGIAFVNAHGTATLFNDQMESKAIERAGLSSVPVSALKGYYGHTLGAAGILEAVISMCAVDDGVVIPTRGFVEKGVSGKVNIAVDTIPADRDSFLKIISGFGGCNAAALYSRAVTCADAPSVPVGMKTLHNVHLTQDKLEIDGITVATEGRGPDLLNEIYRKHIADYPKFHKMDMLSKLVFAATELLVRKGDDAREYDDMAVVLFNCTSSITADRQHIGTISDKDNFFPSPSVFVYTLPNISIGEIAIRNGFRGETSLYILKRRDDELMDRIVNVSSACHQTRSMLTGWVDCSNGNEFEADLKILVKN